MVSLMELWLPILVSAVLVFVVSSIIHMVLQTHKDDCRRLPGEEKMLTELRAQGIPRGHYAFPHPGSMKNMCSPEMLEKYREGPVGYLIVMPNGPPAIGKNLVQWFLHSIAVGVLVAYVAGVAIPRGSDFMIVFRVAGTAGILGYAMGHLVDSIWMGHPWSNTIKHFLDGVVYGLVTGAAFALLWPAVST